MKKKLVHHNFSANHAFLTKNVGGTHKYINKGTKTIDSDEIKNNHKQALLEFDTSFDKINVVNQCHSNKVIILEKNLEFTKEPLVDAMVTKNENIVLGILTADCVPVLFADESERIVGIAHAGWRGAKSGILEKTYEAMASIGAKNISACIGPCIHQISYEVGSEFYQNFIHDDFSNKEFFQIIDNKLFFDLQNYVIRKLQQLGIKNIDNINVNTYDDSTNFFSFRRFTHNPNENYGSCISLIKA